MPGPFKVTEKAMRPASPNRECFYCKQPVGGEHKADCVLVQKTVLVQASIEYEVTVPASWNEEDILFHRNESSWCQSNIIRELEELDDRGCLCEKVTFEYPAQREGEPFLSE